MEDDRNSIGTDADPHPTRFKKGWKGGPGRPKGVKNGEGQEKRNGEMVERVAAPPQKKIGRPKGSRNKYSLSAADRMIDLGFDPIEQYMKLLDEVRAEGNKVLEERILSRLVPFRFATLHHSLITNTQDTDLQVNVTQFQVPDVSLKNGDGNADITEAPGAELEPASTEPLGVNVTRFAPPSAPHDGQNPSKIKGGGGGGQP